MMTPEDLAPYADWIRCGVHCDGEPPEALLALALTVSDHIHEVSVFVQMAHCCACYQHCPCGGYLAVSDLEAVLEAFGDASTPPRRADWWHAVMAGETVHADHHATTPRPVVCTP